MAYERINWQDAPSTDTPLSAENLNTMDSKIADLDSQVTQLDEKHEALEDDVELLERRIDTLVARPEGATGIYNIIDGGGTGSTIENDLANIAAGNYSHAEGNNTRTIGNASHAEGKNTSAEGEASHTEGFGAFAYGSYSHAEGNNTVTFFRSQHVSGEFNEEDPSVNDNTKTVQDRGTYVEIIGNGTDRMHPSNARTLDWDGNEVLAGDLTINGNTSVGDSLSSIQTALSNKITIEGTKMVIHA